MLEWLIKPTRRCNTMKWKQPPIKALILATFLGGCFRQSIDQPLLITKQEDNGPLASMGAGQYVFRIFGTKRAFAALYNPANGNLASIYKILIKGTGEDFWPLVAEDARMTRESRYFAVSRTITPALFPVEPGPSGVSFRADIFRGNPNLLSVVGRNRLVKIDELIFRQKEVANPAAGGSHILVRQADEYHAVPLKADDSLLSFIALEGLTPSQVKANWLAATLEPDAGSPANTSMGCSANYKGTISLPESTPENEIRAYCEKQGRAGAE